MVNTYNLFISHSWAYSNEYENLVALLDSRPYFSYKNYSIPKDDPIHTRGTVKELEEAITRQMRSCHVVLILAGVYASYSKWIDKEIQIAKELRKPIIAVEGHGAERTSQTVKDNADVVVRWNAESIVDEIRRLS